MARQVINGKATNPEELKAEMVEISLANPKAAITAHTYFGIVRIYITKSLARLPLDDPDTREMLNVHNGFIAYVNGELVKPTPGWIARKNIYDVRSHNDR